VAPALLPVGRIARAHGVRGRVLLAPYNDGSEGLERAKALWLRLRVSPGVLPQGVPRKYEIDRAERVHLGYLVAFRGVEGRDQADALRGAEALVDREELPELTADELYAIDLIGMALFDEAGQQRGEVVGLTAAGPNELLRVKLVAGALRIAGAAEKEALVPMGLVREIDQDAKRVVVAVPEGLFDIE
jgi:16S rRNA processing protein RimM